MRLSAGKQWRYRHREQTVDTVGEGDSGMNWESSMETYITVCKTVSGNLLYDAGSSNQMLSDNLEGCDGMGGGREV